MTVTHFLDKHKVDTWWALTKVRAYRVTYERGQYVATCNGVTGKGSSLRTAVQVAAMRAHKTQRCFDSVPF